MDTATREGVSQAVLDRESLRIGVIDLVVLVGLIVFGQLSHGIDPITAPLASAGTVVPFVVGWLVVSLLAGLYTRGVASSPTRVARLATVTWLGAANVGFLLRGSPLLEGGVPWTFTAVMTGFGLVVLVGWRVGYAAFLARS
ncbi:DUF3054 domain-containing protein [Natronobacterium gregoryi]|uniref:DUF3054 domain-containing protein n=2 Tax=Natronobacterium gregoryi TaxID=44930 RepID=L0ALP4_NATGS|nr:DUF3054 domain-containing protein [Natronobacterium gregoryi]AFZ74706.1 Protein of unknown function (DUF3054) [Natronobacterium gregoryi SP2]ELY73389.1 hypothetical protein C490_01450 [Natronobacterium gregoryi SP2]PLK20950.1 DUF3054 domain-containing protein [Natronobacterium gregoryi SP2]SFJ04427.1 Protein of unknown function [Natronobacterium gregoryi]